MITADHKVLSEESESRNIHRYAVVVQDLATQWIQPNPRKTKTSQETQKSLMKFLEPTRKPKVIYTYNSMEEFSRSQCTSTTTQIRNRSVRRVKKRHLRCYCNPVWVTNGGRILWNVTAICETFKISCLMGRHHMKAVRNAF